MPMYTAYNEYQLPTTADVGGGGGGGCKSMKYSAVYMRQWTE